MLEAEVKLTFSDTSDHDGSLTACHETKAELRVPVESDNPRLRVLILYVGLGASWIVVRRYAIAVTGKQIHTHVSHTKNYLPNSVITSPRLTHRYEFHSNENQASIIRLH